MTENALQVFSNDQLGDLRIINIDGVSWFLAADVCTILEHSNVTMALGRVDDEDKAKLNLGLRGGESNVVNESGLYSLILGSRKPEAKLFKRWVTREVLPVIRETGGYVANEQMFVDSYFPDADESLKLILTTSLTTVKRQQAQLDAQKPLVDFANHVADTTDLLTVSQMAKIANSENINIGRNKLFDWMRERGYLRHNNEPYQEYIDRGYFKVRETHKSTAYGPQFYTQTFVTGRGQIFLVEKLREEFGTAA